MRSFSIGSEATAIPPGRSEDAPRAASISREVAESLPERPRGLGSEQRRERSRQRADASGLARDLAPEAAGREKREERREEGPGRRAAAPRRVGPAVVEALFEKTRERHGAGVAHHGARLTEEADAGAAQVRVQKMLPKTVLPACAETLEQLSRVGHVVDRKLPHFSRERRQEGSVLEEELGQRSGVVCGPS